MMIDERRRCIEMTMIQRLSLAADDLEQKRNLSMRMLSGNSTSFSNQRTNRITTLLLFRVFMDLRLGFGLFGRTPIHLHV
jgi:hypothetical protein